jgi:hypothetical protein
VEGGVELSWHWSPSSRGGGGKRSPQRRQLRSRCQNARFVVRRISDAALPAARLCDTHTKLDAVADSPSPISCFTCASTALVRCGLHARCSSAGSTGHTAAATERLLHHHRIMISDRPHHSRGPASLSGRRTTQTLAGPGSAGPTFAGPACAACFWIGALSPAAAWVWCQQQQVSQTAPKAGNACPHARALVRDRDIRPVLERMVGTQMMTTWPLGALD